MNIIMSYKETSLPAQLSAMTWWELDTARCRWVDLDPEADNEAATHFPV